MRLPLNGARAEERAKHQGSRTIVQLMEPAKSLRIVGILGESRGKTAP